ncbi:YjgB family protein [Clostridium sp.]|uniref:YjgB family protein n=1 Tax=Clostridium sp. TaxID=1506 RepID=UPI0028430CDC|nr:YjgB family protein [Clostridium sp.]MDR3595520.1 YjgB family protein [Clostridium sp.]
MRKLNKKLGLVISIALCLIIITGCSNSNKSSNDTSNNTKADNETSNTPDQSKSEENKTAESEKNKTIDNSEKENNQDSILKNIKTLAEEGKIINSNFADNTSNISEVEDKLGKADKSEWVTDAKGNYSTYSKYNVVFGSNKGGRIYEIRSFDISLNNISLSKVEKYFGTPDHNASFNGEKILGYVAGADYKILFVFKAGSDSNDDPKLDHYSVLYPKGTVNSMAGDPGREW